MVGLRDKSECLIARSVLHSTIVVLLVLLGIQIFMTLVTQLSDIGVHHFGLSEAFIYVLLTLPKYIYQFFPMAALIGTLLGMGDMASHSELTVLQASGVSKAKFSLVILKIGLLMTMFAFVVGEIAGPTLYRQAERLKTQWMTVGQVVHTQYGLWVRSGHDFLHIKSAHDLSLQGITRYRFNHQMQLQSISIAKSASFLNNHWRMEGVTQSQISKHRVRSHYKNTQQWDIVGLAKILGSHTMGLNSLDPNFLSLEQLNHLRKIEPASKSIAFNFWQRMVQPFSTLVMMLLGLPFIFGSLRESSMGFRLLIGITIGFSFYLLNQFFGSWSQVYQLPALLSALLPTVLVASVCLYQIFL